MTHSEQPTDQTAADSHESWLQRSMSRRTVLQRAGVVLTGASAGCIGSSGPSSDRIRWRTDVRGRPVLTGETLYVMGRLTLHALSPTDGSTRWATEYSERDFEQRLCLDSNIATDSGQVYVPGCDGLRAIDRSDGEQAWFVESSLRHGVGVADGRVYANGETLLAIDAARGDVVWQVTTEGDRLTRPAATTDGVVLTNRVDGVVTAFTADGERRWRHRTDAETRSPTIAGDTVYVATSTAPERAGRLLALNRADGAVRWAVETPSPKRGTRPVVDGDTVYLGCSGRDHGTLVALDRTDGSERWSFTDENSTVYEPAVTDDAVYAGSNDDHVYALARTGDLQWHVETNGVVGTVVAGPDLLYAATTERLLALDRS